MLITIMALALTLTLLTIMASTLIMLIMLITALIPTLLMITKLTALALTRATITRITARFQQAPNGLQRLKPQRGKASISAPCTPISCAPSQRTARSVVWR